MKLYKSVVEEFTKPFYVAVKESFNAGPGDTFLAITSGGRCYPLICRLDELVDFKVYEELPPVKGVGAVRLDTKYGSNRNPIVDPYCISERSKPKKVVLDETTKTKTILCRKMSPTTLSHRLYSIKVQENFLDIGNDGILYVNNDLYVNRYFSICDYLDLDPKVIDNTSYVYIPKASINPSIKLSEDLTKLRYSLGDEFYKLFDYEKRN